MLIPGENDVKTMRPALAEQWDYEKNKPTSQKTIQWAQWKLYGGSVSTDIRG